MRASLSADRLSCPPPAAASWSEKIIFESYRSRPIKVDFPSSTDPQVMNLSKLIYADADPDRRRYRFR